MRVLSGIQPTGRLHLGNYFGMMRPMLEYQQREELFCFIVNYHALTASQDGRELRTQTLEAASDFLALGLDPSKSVFWVQSDLPEVAELTWILSHVTSMGLLERCHSYKDKIASGLKPNHGLFAYPVLMAADILIMQGEKIPVGADQKQHLEVARDIAQRFNHLYGETFTVPEPEIQVGGKMLPGIDGRKMSKSYDNVIEIFCDREELKRRIMACKTDSIAVEEAKRVSENNLFLLYAAFLDDKDEAALRKRFETPGLKYSDVKSELIDLIWNHFEPYRERREELHRKPKEVLSILKKGAERARQVAAPTLREVREKVGLAYG